MRSQAYVNAIKVSGDRQGKAIARPHDAEIKVGRFAETICRDNLQKPKVRKSRSVGKEKSDKL